MSGNFKNVWIMMSIPVASKSVTIKHQTNNNESSIQIKKWD